MIAPRATSEATWVAMRSELTLEAVLLILAFTGSTFYESRQANRYCYGFQQESGRLRALCAKTFLEQQANMIYRVYLRLWWDTFEIDDHHAELSVCRQWWRGLVCSACTINMVLQNAGVRSWRLRVLEFAAVNADVLARLCQQDGGAELTHELVLPVWTDEPASWCDATLGRMERNAHLAQRLGDEPLSRFGTTDDLFEESFIWENQPEAYVPEVNE